MGNLFDSRKLPANKYSSDRPNVSNLPNTVPNNKMECAMLISGYLRSFMVINRQISTIIPMDVVDIIGALHSYLNMIEQKAIAISNITSKSSNTHKSNEFAKDKMSQMIKYLMDEYQEFGFFKDEDPNELIINFLYFNRENLDKDTVGVYFEGNLVKFDPYLQLFDFKDHSIDMALREFCSALSLPGEAQQIDHIMDAFAEKYKQDNERNDVIDDLLKDEVYIIIYSVLMLNVNLHGRDIRRRMTKQEFINASGIKGKTAKNILSDIYERVKKSPIME